MCVSVGGGGCGGGGVGVGVGGCVCECTTISSFLFYNFSPSFLLPYSSVCMYVYVCMNVSRMDALKYAAAP